MKLSDRFFYVVINIKKNWSRLHIPNIMISAPLVDVFLYTQDTKSSLCLYHIKVSLTLYSQNIGKLYLHTELKNILIFNPDT